jgi:hypothetical protein
MRSDTSPSALDISEDQAETSAAQVDKSSLTAELEPGEDEESFDDEPVDGVLVGADGAPAVSG